MFGVRKLYQEDIDKYTESNGCVPKSGKKYQNKDGVLDITAWYLDDPMGYVEWGQGIQVCSDEFYKDGEQTGCCIRQREEHKC